LVKQILKAKISGTTEASTESSKSSTTEWVTPAETSTEGMSASCTAIKAAGVAIGVESRGSVLVECGLLLGVV
jgi:hypothetical protein